MTRIAGAWLTAPETQEVVRALDGHEVLFVGGCVRNALLGVPVADIDISTDARPDTVMALAEAAGLKAVPTGIDHGTVTVIAGEEPFEITTYRRDVETDGRRAVVHYADTYAEDALRRDFTINALYADAEGVVRDPVGGLDDIAHRRIRFIEDAEQRIHEDYLRILRFFRFHAWYGDQMAGLDPEGLAACAAGVEGIGTLSRERVGAEMRKLLAAPDPAPSVAAMATAGVLGRVLPGADAEALPRLVHLEDGLAPDAMRRLACLTAQDPTDALRLSRDDARRVERYATLAREGADPGETAYRLGAQAARNIALIRAALLAAPVPDETEARIAAGAAAVFPVKAADLMPAYQGKALGDRLAALEARWIASGFTLDKAALLA